MDIRDFYLIFKRKIKNQKARKQKDICPGSLRGGKG